MTIQKCTGCSIEKITEKPLYYNNKIQGFLTTSLFVSRYTKKGKTYC